jgi:hypothetical protein
VNDLLPYLAGAASAFVVQFLIQIYVVPHVDTRRRRLERWEKDVLDLGDLLSTTMSDMATDAMSGQLRVRLAAMMSGNADFDQAKAKRELSEGQLHAQQATRKLISQVTFRSLWVIDRIATYRASDLVIEFVKASLHYRIHVLKLVPEGWRELSDEDFNEWWATENKLRADWIESIMALARARHPLRRSWRLRLRTLKSRIGRLLAKLTRQPVESELTAADAEEPGTATRA